MHQDTLNFYKYRPVKKPQYQGKFCSTPFNTLQIDSDGDVQLCDCQLHMPYTIGNIYKNTLQEIWLGESAKQVRQSVIDGDFTYCNWACGSLNNLQTKPKEGSITTPEFPKIIKLDMDRSCNLKCPSCRESVIIEKNSNKIDQQIRLYSEIKKWAQDNPALTLTLIPVASGEIFASHSGLSFLNSLLDYPYRNLRIDVTTNGTLINRNQELIKNISHLLGNFRVSIDAATPETYAVVRGGDWDELMLGLNFIKDNLKKSLQFNFCIQKNNWHEIKLFAELAHKFGAKISYQKLLDWGHWDIAWWHDNNVFDRTRNTFDPVIDALLQVQAQYPHKIGMVGGIDKYLKQSRN